MTGAAGTRGRLVVLAAVGWGCGLNASGLAGGDGGDTGLPQCGNGRVEGAEECDDGNRVPGDGCESSCLFSCHRDDECDDGDQCTRDSCQTLGAGKDCVNVFVPGLSCSDGNPCTRDSEDHCEWTDAGVARCVGGTNECVCAVRDDCAPYEDGDLCNGTLDCIGRHCEIDPTTIVVCDPSGNTTCRRNTCDPRTGTCRWVPQGDGIPCDDGDWCTLLDQCRGTECVSTGARCPYSCQVCNGTMFRCDPAPGYCIIGDACIPEFNPSSPDPRALNPANRCQGCQPSVDPYGWSNLDAGVSCDDGFWCNGLETCDGRGTCSSGSPPCPIGGCINGCDEGTDSCVPEPNTTECRPSAGPCDVPERCDGTSLTCPTDRFQPATEVCRPAAGPCDMAETCTGSSAACPTDSFQPATEVCRPAAGPCDVAETCTGSSAGCPTDSFQPATEVCRPAAGPCDVAETCMGSSASCPADDGAPDNSTCSDSGSGGVCCGGTCQIGWSCCDNSGCSTDTHSDHCDATGDHRCECGSTGGPCVAPTGYCCPPGSLAGTCVSDPGDCERPVL